MILLPLPRSKAGQFRGNQYMDDKRRKRIISGLLGGGAVAGGGSYRAYTVNRDKKSRAQRGKVGS